MTVLLNLRSNYALSRKSWEMTPGVTNVTKIGACDGFVEGFWQRQSPPAPLLRAKLCSQDLIFMPNLPPPSTLNTQQSLGQIPTLATCSGRPSCRQQHRRSSPPKL